MSFFREQKKQYEVAYNRRRNNNNRGSSRDQLTNAIDEKIHACGDYDMDGDVEIVVARDGDQVVAVAAQDKVFSEAGDELVITVRTNAEPDNCIVYFEDDKVVELNRGNDNCNTRFQNSKVCLQSYVKPQEGIFSCIVKIDSFNRRLEGRWEIEIIKKIVRTDEVKELAAIDATLIELPDEVYLVYDGEKVGPRDNIRPRDPGPIEVNCEVVGGTPAPELRLYTGDIPVNEASERKCRDTIGRERDTTCTSFEFTPKKTHKTQGEITCVAVVPGVDSFKSQKLTASADLRIQEYAATLKESSGDAITICDPDARVGREFLIEIEFEADPEPEIVEWTMQVNEGDTTDAIEAGYTEGDYTTYELEEKRRGTFVASMRIERLSQDDLDVPQNHELLVENEVGTSVYRITIDTSDECEENQDHRKRTPRDSERQTKKQRKSSRQRAKKYKCDPKDEDDCRCDDPDRPRECCDASRNCRRNCCERCKGGTKRKSRTCNLCDDREQNCMKAEEDDDDDDDDDDQVCESGDRDCICVDYENEDGDDEEYCCSDKSGCRGRDCCDSCRDEDDDDCFCKSRGRDCVTVPEKLLGESNDKGGKQCRSGDRDCICVEYEDEDGDDEEFCCSDKSGCRGSNCCDTCRKNDDDCYCDGRDCVEVPSRLTGGKGSSDIEVKLKDAMLEGCIKLGSTILDHYEPSGSKRRGSPSDKDIEDDLEEFFEDATCTGYDKDIQDYFKDNDRKRSRRTKSSVTKGREGVVAFTSLNPANKVQRVSAAAAGQRAPTADYDPELVGLALDFAKNKARLDRGN